MLLRKSLEINQLLLLVVFALAQFQLLLPTESFLFATFALATRRESIQSDVDLLLTGTGGMSSSLSAASAPVPVPDPPKAIRWGIVGLGDVCVVKSGPAFYKCNGSELVAVMRRTPGKAQEFASNVPGGGCTGYEDIDEFLLHPGLDAVYVSTRPGTHVEICEKVARAGKACYVEKPVGRCAEETEQIAKVFKDAKLPLYTAYISRAYERTQCIRKLLAEGAIGKDVTSVSYKLIGSGGARDMDGDLPWRLDAKQSGGGLIMDVGCHVLDRIDYLCGPLVNVEGKAMNKNSTNVPVEDYVELIATIGEGGIWAAIPHRKDASVACTWDFASTSEAPLDELKFIGDKGFLKMSAMSFAPIEVYDASGILVKTESFEPPQHTAQNLIQVVTNDLLGVGVGEEKFLPSGDNAIRTSKVLDIVLNSYYGGREVGYWSRTNWPGTPKVQVD